MVSWRRGTRPIIRVSHLFFHPVRERGLADDRKVAVVLARVLHSVLANFADEGVFHVHIQIIADGAGFAREKIPRVSMHALRPVRWLPSYPCHPRNPRLKLFFPCDVRSGASGGQVPGGEGWPSGGRGAPTLEVAMVYGRGFRGPNVEGRELAP